MKHQKRKVGDLQVVEIPGDPAKGAIVLLHGYGADPFDLLPLSSLYSGPTWIFPEGPLQIPFAPGYTGQAWFPVNMDILIQAIREKKFDEVSLAFPSGIEQARTLVENFLEELKIPRSHIVLGGFSQGAVLAVETALKSHEKCGGLLVFSGTLVNQLDWKKLAPLHAKTPFFQSHGSHDPLLPIEKAQELEKLFIDSGLKGELHAFQGGHEIPHSILAKIPSFLKALFH